MIPLKCLGLKVYDRGTSDKTLAELTIESLDWDYELKAFIQHHANEERNFIKLFMVAFIRVKYSDLQDNTRNAQYYVRSGGELQRIGNIMWARSKTLYDGRLKENFFVLAGHSNGKYKLSELFKREQEHLSKYCVPIGLHFEGDVRSIFLY